MPGGVFQVSGERAFTTEGAENSRKRSFTYLLSLCVLRVLCGEKVFPKV
jgi:hypothetical protein